MRYGGLMGLQNLSGFLLLYPHRRLLAAGASYVSGGARSGGVVTWATA
jgi:hypothetical protein